MSKSFESFKNELIENEEKKRDYAVVIKDFCLTHGKLIRDNHAKIQKFNLMNFF